MKHSLEADTQTHGLDPYGKIYSMEELASAGLRGWAGVPVAVIFGYGHSLFKTSDGQPLGPHFAHKLEMEYHNDIGLLYNSMTSNNKEALVRCLYGALTLLTHSCENMENVKQSMDALAEFIQEATYELTLHGYDQYSNPVNKVKRALINLQNQ